MQIGEEDLALAQHRALDRLRFLDFDDHLGALEDVFGAGGDLRAGAPIVVVGRTDACAGIGLDQHRWLCIVISRTEDGVRPTRYS